MRTKLPITILILTLCSATSVRAAATAEFHRTVDLAPTGSFELQSHNGSVVITPWNQPSASIEAHLESDDSSGEEDVRNTVIRVEGHGDNVRVETDFSGVRTFSTFFGFDHELPQVHYVVHVPATVHLSVSVHNSTVKIDGFRSAVSVESHNGNIEIANLAAPAEIETHNGDIRLAFARYEGPTRITTHNGEAQVLVPADARLSVSTDAHRHDPFTTDLPVTIRSKSFGMSGTVNGGGAELRFRSHNGSLHLGRA